MDNASTWVTRAHRNAGALVGIGVLEIILGFIVLLSPLAGGLAVTVILGLSLMMGGIVRLFAAFQADSFGSGALAFIWGLLVAVAGFHIFTNPGIALVTLTLVLSTLFFVTGLIQIVVSFHMKPAEGWGWMLLSGILAVLLAIMAWRQFPISSIWLVGTLAGIQILSVGMTTLAVGRAARKVTKMA